MNPNIREWLIALGTLTAVSSERSDAASKLAAYVPLLAEEFSPGAFTHASLAHVARQCVKGFPTYPELCQHLSAWWRNNRPTPIAIGSDQPATILQREIERDRRESWERMTVEDVLRQLRKLQSDPNSPSDAASRRLLVAALEQYAPHHLALLPRNWRSNPASAIPPRKPDAPPQAPARRFSREQLSAAYAKAGLVAPQPKERANAPA